MSNVVTAAKVVAALVACGASPNSYYYTATPAYSSDENGFCNFAKVGAAGIAQVSPLISFCQCIRRAAARCSGS